MSELKNGMGLRLMDGGYDTPDYMVVTVAASAWTTGSYSVTWDDGSTTSYTACACRCDGRQPDCGIRPNPGDGCGANGSGAGTRGGSC